MKFIWFVLLAIYMLASFKKDKTKITLSVKDEPLKSVFNKITERTDYRFNYLEGVLVGTHNVSFTVKEENIETVLKICVKDQPIKYTREGDVVIIEKDLSKIPKVYEFEEKIDGVITNQDGDPVQNAKISIKGEHKETNSNARGKFILNSRSPNINLLINAKGFFDQSVEVKNVFSIIRIKLVPSSEMLGETIIIGYGKVSRKLKTSNTDKVRGEDIGKQPVTNILGALSGRVTGLLITPTNGYYGSSYTSQINGQSSIGVKRGRLPFNDPLYVIDGVPYAPNNNSVQVLSSGTALGPNGKSALISIDPDNIESIEVLKDADGTAIYGSRGAKGVILITTKRGKEGKVKINVDLRNGMSGVTRFPEMLNARQFTEMRLEALKNDNINRPSSPMDNDILRVDADRDLNFGKELLSHTAKRRSVLLAISGGSTRLQYYLGGNYHEETSIYSSDKSNIERNLNLHVNYQSLNQKFNSYLSVNYSNNDIKLPTSDIFNSLTLPSKSPPLYDNLNNVYWGLKDYSFNNPLANLFKSYNSKTNNVLVSLTLSYKIIKNFYIKTNIGFNNNSTNEYSIFPIKSINPLLVTNRTGTVYFGKGLYKSSILDPQLEYKVDIGQGKLNMQLGVSLQGLTNENNKYSATGYPDDAHYSDTLAAKVVNHDIPRQSRYKYRGMFGRIGYNWRDKYIVNITGRQERSNRMTKVGQSGLFGAIGTAWIFSNEPFFNKKLNFFSFGKVRLSAGIVGNDQSGNYQYFDSWDNSQSPDYDASKKLKWETTRKVNGGLELGFFNDKLYLTIDYYYNRTGDQLISMPSVTGTGIYVTNWPAVVVNNGFEFEILYKSDLSKKFKWEAEVTLTIPHNKLQSFSELSSSPYKMFQEGESLTMQQGYHYLGVDRQTGIFRFEDRNKDGNLRAADDYVISNNLDPKIYGGVRYDMSYINWHVGLFIEGRRQKGYGLPYSIYNTAAPGTPMKNQPAVVMDRWQKPGDIASFQLFTTGGNDLANAGKSNMLQSDLRFTDASFLRIKNLYFTFDLYKNWLNKLHLYNGSIYVQLYNYFTITKYRFSDPETQSFNTLPALKTCVIGIRVGV